MTPPVGEYGNLSVRLAEPPDADALAPRLRPWDMVECMAFGHDPGVALHTPFAQGLGHMTWTIEQNGKVIGMGGLAPIEQLASAASIWFLGSEEIDNSEAGFLRISRLWVAYALSRFETIGNVVPERCEKTIRWLQWLGFDTKPELVHLRGIRFLRFSRKSGGRPD